MTTERTVLTTRVLPLMTLGTGLLGHECFRLGGNAIVTGSAGDLGFVDLMDRDVSPAEADARVSVPGMALLSPVATLLNFAGMVCCGHALDCTSKNWNCVSSVNTIGAFFVACAAARYMIAHNPGVNIPQPQVPYNASKAGVKAIVRSLAAECAYYGIQVDSISPGKIWLSRRPLGRMRQPDELCGAVVMLANRAGSHFNGSGLLVDGGQTQFM
ncbi:oxidoreductase-like protein [Hypoxylon argillaceum]|nr:oxidoreductase-like protein [Hypoxylon argillaceum]